MSKYSVLHVALCGMSIVSMSRAGSAQPLPNGQESLCSQFWDCRFDLAEGSAAGTELAFENSISQSSIGASTATAETARTGNAPRPVPDDLLRAATARQSLDDAWWTGPLLTASAATLPRGRVLFEPYFYDVISRDSEHFGSRSYILYGLTDEITVGVIPVFGYNKPRNGRASSGIGLGDVSLQAQYRLTQFQQGSPIPTISAVVQQRLPTGKHDRLGDRPSDGFGTGAPATTIALYAQSYFWMPNGRILRARLNLGKTFAGRAKVEGTSVYGTSSGFRGHARSGASFDISGSLEYSLTRNWVLALDVGHSRSAATRVSGIDDSDPENPTDVRYESRPYRGFVFAPAIEYNWTSNLGVILGARLIPASRGRAATYTPALAINMVL